MPPNSIHYYILKQFFHSFCTDPTTQDSEIVDDLFSVKNSPAADAPLERDDKLHLMQSVLADDSHQLINT